jgi:hypothetical protein
MEEFVTFEIAKKLKEKGFIGNGHIGCCCGFYCEEGFDINIVYDDLDNSELLCNEYLRPTITQALKWLREEHKLHVCIDLDHEKNWFYFIQGINNNFEYIDEFEYSSYEDAAISGIGYVLNELIIQNNCSMKVQDLIELINNSEDLYCLGDAEDIIPKDVNCVASELDVDKHRWFSTAVDVYACKDGYVGVYGVNTIYSEHMAPRDCNYPCGALEYELVQITSYKPKTSV